VNLAETLPAGAATKVFKLEGGEAAVKGSLVKTIEIGKDSAVVSFLNQGTAAASPDCSVRVFNAYGMQLGAFRLKWLVATLAPGAVKKEDARFLTPDLETTFRFAALKLPADWSKPAYLMIDGAVF
jgi:hypothetical protein